MGEEYDESVDTSFDIDTSDVSNDIYDEISESDTMDISEDIAEDNYENISEIVNDSIYEDISEDGESDFEDVSDDEAVDSEEIFEDVEDDATDDNSENDDISDNADSTDVETIDSEEILEDVEDDISYDDSNDSGIVKNDFDQLTDYMNKNNYGRDDFETYSQDPEWRELHRKVYPDYDMPPIMQENAYNQLTDYMHENNYTQEDLETYSQDPKWRELQMFAFPDYELPALKDGDNDEVLDNTDNAYYEINDTEEITGDEFIEIEEDISDNVSKCILEDSNVENIVEDSVSDINDFDEHVDTSEIVSEETNTFEQTEIVAENDVVQENSDEVVEYLDTTPEVGIDNNSGIENSEQGSDNSDNHDNTSDMQNWLTDINPNYDPFDYESPYSNNCGSCSLAVYQRLEGIDDSSVASAENIGYNHEMNAITGMEQVSMSPSEIEQRLLEQGDGSHAIIGVDRAEGPGHWFNAACMNGKVVAIDGQTGEITDWPPDYGNVVNWEMSIKKEDK